MKGACLHGMWVCIRWGKGQVKCFVRSRLTGHGTKEKAFITMPLQRVSTLWAGRAPFNPPTHRSAYLPAGGARCPRRAHQRPERRRSGRGGCAPAPRPERCPGGGPGQGLFRGEEWKSGRDCYAVYMSLWDAATAGVSSSSRSQMSRRWCAYLRRRGRRRRPASGP